MSHRRNANNLHKASLTLNDRLALFITRWVGTMWAAYLFTLIAFVALPQAIESHSMTVLINWFSGNWMQFVLLPIIMVGQSLSNRHSEQLAEEMYKADIDAEQRIIAVQEKLEDIEMHKLDEIINILKSWENTKNQPLQPSRPNLIKNFHLKNGQSDLKKR